MGKKKPKGKDTEPPKPYAEHKKGDVEDARLEIALSLLIFSTNLSNTGNFTDLRGTMTIAVKAFCPPGGPSGGDIGTGILIAPQNPSLPTFLRPPGGPSGGPPGGL